MYYHFENNVSIIKYKLLCPKALASFNIRFEGIYIRFVNKTLV
jgi:hypothetical protein